MKAYIQFTDSDKVFKRECWDIISEVCVKDIMRGWNIYFISTQDYTFLHHINTVGFQRDASTCLVLCCNSTHLLVAFLYWVSTR